MGSGNFLFLDRDGVINRKLEGRYVQDSSEFEFMPGAINAIAKLTKIFDRLLIVTNQQGIAKGIMTDEDLKTLHEYMQQQLSAAGGKIDKIYYCPHLANDACACRKPQPGMIEQAISDFPEIDVNQSFLIGDSDTDILAAEAMNINAIKVDDEYTLAVWCDELISVI